MKCIGINNVSAVSMNRRDYCRLRNWDVPENENSDDDGYLVEYLDGEKPNCEELGFKGYISWSPKEVFDNAYREIDKMTFGLAIEALKKGLKVARTGWNGKGMFLYLVEGSTFAVNRPPLNKIYPEGTIINYRPHIDMKTADDKIVPWVASQSDVLSEDWIIVD